MNRINVLAEKTIVLGVTGSIAAYKSADLASKLTQAGAMVDVILTESAQRFISPLTFRSVTGREVATSMWALDDHVRHVRIGETADLFVIAPATAHTIAKLASGFADNLLTVSVLAARSPILVAPAMDGGMYAHPATEKNVQTLKERGVYIAGPVEGRMASGLVGLGRMVEPRELIGHLRLVAGRDGPLRDRKVLVTAGPTEEPLDPVRFLSNRSSGRQGVALAQAAIDAGAEVILIAGPTREDIPIGCHVFRVRSAQEMHDAVLAEVDKVDVLIMAAAVSDYRPSEFVDKKIKKSSTGSTGLSVPLSQNPDILSAVYERRKQEQQTTECPRVVVGFAAETHNLHEYGMQKLRKKGLDLIAINDVGEHGAGFAVETNKVRLISANGQEWDLPLMSKVEVAERIVEIVANLLNMDESQDLQRSRDGRDGADR